MKIFIYYIPEYDSFYECNDKLGDFLGYMLTADYEFKKTAYIFIGEL